MQRSALLLRDLLADYPEQAWLARDILLCEQEGDRIVHDILHRLAERGSRRAHLDSADMHALAGALDDIVDFAEEAADQLALYGVEAPMEQAQAMSEVLVLRPSRSRRACAGCATGSTSARSSSRSTGSRTRATGSSAPPSPISSWPASTR